VTDVSTEVPEADPKSTLSYRSLRAVVIILGVLIVLALVLVVVGIGMRMSGHVPGQSGTAGNYALPAGSKIEHTDIAGSNLVLTVKTPQGEAVYIFSASDGRFIGRIAPKAP
jgi:hypothetical protein